MEDTIKLFFNNVIIEKDEDDIYIIKSEGNCLEFFIEKDNNIGIKQLNKCKLSGGEILERIELFANHINSKYIYLDDKSTLKIGDVEINFAILYILSNGYSWYNKFGFYQTNYILEKKKWNRIREMTFRECKSLFLNAAYMEPNNYYMYGLEYYSLLSDVEITKSNYIESIIDCYNYLLENLEDLVDMKIKEASSLIFIAIKDKIYENNMQNFTNYIFYISLLAYIIEYTRYPLYKSLDNNENKYKKYH